MKCFSHVNLLLCGCLAVSTLCLAPIARADDDPAAAPSQADASEKQADAGEDKSLAEQAKENPNDAQLLNKWFGQEFNRIFGQIQSDPDAAEKALKDLSKAVKQIEATEAAAKAMLSRAESVITSFQDRIALSRVTLEEAAEQLQANPTDEKALSTYSSKVLEIASSVARSDPSQAEQTIEAAKTLLTELSDKSEDEAVQERIAVAIKGFSRLDRTIASAKKLMELIGKNAAPLQVEAWVNGEPLEPGDLKGKVVLLDFWAVWCGPCIATFPHLREWRETYADKGLVIVGLTRYYNYEWDEEANRATRSKEEVSPEAEQKMLAKFAEEHDLQHRFAIQQGNELSEYYAVSGIPHVVVIDQEEKIRMIRVGSGDKNAQDISELLAELLK